MLACVLRLQFRLQRLQLITGTIACNYSVLHWNDCLLRFSHPWKRLPVCRKTDGHRDRIAARPKDRRIAARHRPVQTLTYCSLWPSDVYMCALEARGVLLVALSSETQSLHRRRFGESYQTTRGMLCVPTSSMIDVGFGDLGPIAGGLRRVLSVRPVCSPVARLSPFHSSTPVI